MDHVDCVIVGAGVVGLACARALALAGREVVVVEGEDRIGSETSSRNSEVIHAGIYYPHKSLKARACVEGRKRLYDYCDLKGVSYSRCGKLILATAEPDVSGIRRLVEQARDNGVGDMRWLSGDEVRALEPDVHCVGAALSPSTGIVDSHGLMLALQGDVESGGGMIAFRSRVSSGRVTADGIVLCVGESSNETELLARHVITCAGLHSEPLLRSIGGFPEFAIPKIRYAKGCYFRYSGPASFRRLIYPPPELAGLGVHITLDLGGGVRLGPDVEWVETLDYAVNPLRAEKFLAAAQRYWPSLSLDKISPDYAGIRPKLSGPTEPAADFLIQGPRLHGVRGLVNMLGIESPGLTSCLAISDWAASTVLGESPAG